MRVFYGSALAAGFAIAIGVAAPAVDASDQERQASAIIASCQERARLVDELRPLQDERDRLKQVIANYGFENTVAEQEAHGRTAEEILREHGVNFRKDLLDKSAAEASFVVDNWLKQLEATGKPLTKDQRDMLLKVTAYAPRPVREAVVVIARSEAPSPQFIAAWSDVLEWGGTIGDLYSLAASESEKEIAWKTLMIMAGRVSAPFGLLLTEAEWAAKNLTDVLKLTWTSVQVKSLTAMTENDLTALKSSSAQLGSVAKRIGQINKRLAGTSMDCDSTQLVRAPAEAAPPDSADDKKKGPSTAKTVVGVGAAVGGVAAAAYAYEEYKKLQEENGGGSCGPQPSIDFNPSVQSRPSDAQLNALRTWCRCKGYSGIGNGSNGFGCVQ